MVYNKNFFRSLPFKAQPIVIKYLLILIGVNLYPYAYNNCYHSMGVCPIGFMNIFNLNLYYFYKNEMIKIIIE